MIDGIPSGLKKLFSVVMVTMFLAAPALSYQAGKVSAEGEIVIDSCEELQLIGNDEAYPLFEAEYILESNIDCAATSEWNSIGEDIYEGFNPIGDGDDEFNASFDGNGYSILNLYINRETLDDVGLFGEIGGDGVVMDLSVDDASVTGQGNVGIIAGENEGTIQNSSSSGHVYTSESIVEMPEFSSEDIGGLVGYNDDGYIMSSSSSATIHGELTYRVGGLVGQNEGTISDSFATGTVTGEDRVGGFIGANGGTISSSYSTGEVIGTFMVGGFAGRSGNSIFSSYATGNVSGGENVGGFIGYLAGGSVSKSYATGSVLLYEPSESYSGLSGGGFAGFVSSETSISKSYALGNVAGSAESLGGFVGNNSGDINNAYSHGDITNESYYVGGFVGYNEGTLAKVYSIGSISYITEGSGGLVGYNDNPNEGSVADSFWDEELTGFDFSYGGTGLDTAAMQMSETFEEAGWDFEFTWAIDPEENSGYPFFDFRYLPGIVLLVTSNSQDRDYLERANVQYDVVSTETFATASAEFFTQYDIVIYEPDGNYDDLRSGLVNLALAMQEKQMVVSIRAGGNEGDQENIDFLGTDFVQSYSEDMSIVATEHPFITGEGIGGVLLSEAEFENWGWSTHGYLTSLPDVQTGYQVILNGEFEEVGSLPSWIEYEYEYGFVIVDGMTSIDGGWGGGNDNVADNYIKYLSSKFALLPEPVIEEVEDVDLDGILTEEEDGSPNDGDGNNDGVLDSEQSHVSSFANLVTGSYSVIESDDSCTIGDVGVQPESSKPIEDAGFQYPLGLLQFELDCGTPGYTATVVHYYFGADASDLVLRKYHSINNSYSPISGATISEVIVGGVAAVKVEYQITDGGELDEDGTVNGVIVDPVGLALAAIGAPNTGLKRVNR